MPDFGTSRRVKFTPLKVSCRGTDCPNGLHCYRQNATLSKDKQRPDGECWNCGESDVDWERIHRLDPDDMQHLIQMLRTEFIRNKFWSCDVKADEKAHNHARRKGRRGMEEAVCHRLEKYLTVLTAYDGRQTPQHSNVIFYAQHATATCCRRCIEYWYGIDKDAVLRDDQLAYFADLCMAYINEKLPDLTESGEKVPRRSNPLGA